MKCDRCGQPASIHEVSIRNGKRSERHLCERCAAEAGMVTPQSPPIKDLLNQLLPSKAKLAVPPGKAGPVGGAADEGAGAGGREGGVVPSDRCPRCSATLAQLRDTGVLGCPTCYEAFLPQLVPLLERYHEGGTSHFGKVPKRKLSGEPPRGISKARKKPKAEEPGVALSPAGILRASAERAAAEAVAKLVARMKVDLAAAVKCEDYRTAAELRDALAEIENPTRTAAAALCVSEGPKALTKGEGKPDGKPDSKSDARPSARKRTARDAAPPRTDQSATDQNAPGEDSSGRGPQP